MVVVVVVVVVIVVAVVVVIVVGSRCLGSCGSREGHFISVFVLQRVLGTGG